MNNQLSDVPNELAALTRLTQFDFSGNLFSTAVQQKILNMMSSESSKPAKKGKKKAPAKRSTKKRR
jgi:Leucine-rich repeat (LRR) protein